MKQVTIKLTLAVIAFLLCSTIHAEIVNSGTYGNNITWTLDDNDVLTIDGKGEMGPKMYENWQNFPSIPWRYIKTIKKVMINEGVTSVMSYAFELNDQIESISLPQSLEIIEGCAFAGCYSLKTINIPSNIKEIGSQAFSDCCSLPVKNGLTYADTYLVSVSGILPATWEIPEGTEYIGDYVLRSCDISNLKKIVLPSSLKMICSEAFGQELRDVDFTVEVKSPSSLRVVESYAFPDSWKNRIEGNVMLGNVFCGYNGAYPEGGIFEVPEGCVGIAGHAFSCSKYKKIILPSTLTTINGFAFGYASSMEELNIPRNVTYIGREAFFACSSALKTISVEEGNPVFDIRNNCNALIRTKDSTLILGCRNTIIPNTVAHLAEHCFLSCGGLTTINIPSSVRSIGFRAFASSSINDITIPKTVTDICGECFIQSGLKSITFDYGRTYIPSLFRECRSLINVNIPSTVTTIEARAFEECTALRNIVLPRNLTNIGLFAFSSCELDTITCLAKEVPTIELDDYTGSQIQRLSKILVPKESVEKYKAAEFWKDYDIVGIKVVDVSSIDLDKSMLSLNVGDTCHITENVLPKDAYNAGVVWFSDNESIATVDKNGLVTAVSQGSATITALAEDGSNISATCTVDILDPMIDTDISTLANTLYIENTDGKTGNIETLSLKMKNVVAAQGFQCDVYLPEGVTFATDDDGFYRAELSTARTTATKTNYYDCALQSNGALRILCNSTKGCSFSGNDGEVATIAINIEEDMDEGDYPIIIKDIEISDKESNSYTQSYIKSTLTISSYMLGDANGDNKVTVTDFTAVANAILGNTPANYVAKAADVNGDTKITVSDLTGIANIILYGSVNDVSNAKSRVAPSVGNTPEVYVPAFSIESGSSIEVPVYINNGTTSFSAYQLDINLPEGLTITDARIVEERATNHVIQSAVMDNGAYRLLSYSTKGNTLVGTNGPVAIITICADNIARGEYNGEINDIELGENGNPHYAKSSHVNITIGDATGIISINNGNGIQQTYSISGIEATPKHKGVNIIKYSDGSVRKSIVK